MIRVPKIHQENQNIKSHPNTNTDDHTVYDTMNRKDQPVLEEEEEEDVRIENEARPVWLVKIPARVGKEWDKLTEGDVSLGTIRIHNVQGSDGRPSVSLHLKQFGQGSTSSSGAQSAVAIGALPEYKMQFNDKRNPPQLRLFSKGDGGVELHGIVEHTITLQPSLQKNMYKTAVQQRHVAIHNKHQVRTMDDTDDAALQARKTQRIIKLSNSKKADPLASGPVGTKRKRSQLSLEGDEESDNLVTEQIRSVVFELFNEEDKEADDGGKMQFLSLKYIKGRLGEVGLQVDASVIKDVLKKIAIFHTSGVNARCWELKPEYRQQ